MINISVDYAVKNSRRADTVLSRKRKKGKEDSNKTPKLENTALNMLYTVSHKLGCFLSLNKESFNKMFLAPVSAR